MKSPFRRSKARTRVLICFGSKRFKPLPDQAARSTSTAPLATPRNPLACTLNDFYDTDAHKEMTKTYQPPPDDVSNNRSQHPSDTLQSFRNSDVLYQECFPFFPHAGAHHILHGRPRHGPGVKVLLQEGSARVEVAVVELVRDAPSQRTELSPLLRESTTTKLKSRGARLRPISESHERSRTRCDLSSPPRTSCT